MINDEFFTTAVPNAFIDGFLLKAEPVYALIYIYLCRNKNKPENVTVANAAKVFDITEKKCRAAFAALEEAGFLHSSDKNKSDDGKNGESANVQTAFPGVIHDAPLYTARNAPNYSPIEIEQNAKDPVVLDLFQSAQEILARMLSSGDQNCIYAMYEYFGFAPELIKFLLSHCKNRADAENKTSKLKPAYLTAVACDWANRDIKTVSEAEEYVLTFFKPYKAVLKQLGYVAQNPSVAQRAYIDKWLDEYKMPLEIILFACDKATISTNKPNFKYLDKIIENWHEKNITTAQEADALGEAFYENLKPKSAQAKRSKFANFKGHDRNWVEIERRERELIQKMAEGE